MLCRIVFQKAKVVTALLLTSLLVGVLAACGGGSASPSNGPVTLTFWTWVPNIQNEINLFEQSHPNIKIKLVNAGQGTPEYTKLRTALKAGTGAPDVVQLEFQFLPTFVLTGKLVDLAPYGAKDLQNDYVPSAWAQVTQGDKVYAIPQDSGPMGLLYRQDIFEKYHITVPQTWNEYAQAAIALHKANPKIYMTDFAPAQGDWFTGLAWQAGSHPFKVNGTNLNVNINDAPAVKVANYWGNLVQKKVVDTAPYFTNDWYAGLGDGKYATWVAAAWGPVFLSGIAAKSAGKWRAAPLPQWNAGEKASGNWGGSTDSVTAQSQHPKEAAEFTMWLNHDKGTTTMFTQKQFLFPVLKSVLTDPAFNTPSDFYGGQKVNEVFVAASNQVDTNFQWSPFQDYVYTQYGDQIGNAVNGKISFEQAMNNLQTSTITYAKGQGFTVG